IGAYAKLDNGALYGTNFLLIPDLLASEGYIRWLGTFQGYREVSLKTLNDINTETVRTWNQAYSTINLVNNVLEALPVVTDPDKKNQLEGEALLIRGMLYFELVRLYGLPYEAGSANTQLGVPLVLTAAKSLEQASTQQARNTVAEVYQQVITDLTRAESLLPEDNGVRGDMYTAAGFLARVYLQQGDYANALAKADKVISSGVYQLTPNVVTPFRTKNSFESIFEIQQNDQSNAGTSNDGLTTFYASLGGIGRGDVQVEPDFAALYDTTDARFTDLIYEGTGLRAGRLRTCKFTAYADNIPIIRLAEMYLIRAEANFRLGSAVGATPTEDINLIRARAGVKEYNKVTLDQIILERQLELAFEGFRIHDIKRLKGTTGEYAYNAPELVLPIPRRELDANPNLVQNEGY
ncbi:MAG: RagB/SusD family nutrient uptake outer membrane protein, partial [Bacteroidota bacterium]|nr:RagB/SusD family nutrient uptake outer membrane protein [Bacteroidota bacterium]